MQKDFRHAVVGGIALAAYGLPRLTLDLDLVVEARAQVDLIQFPGIPRVQDASSVERLLQSRPCRSDVGIDRLHLRQRRDEPRAVLKLRSLPGPVALPCRCLAEHLVAMKVTAMKNDPGRTFQEMTDIRFLLTLPELIAPKLKLLGNAGLGVPPR